MRPMGGDLGCHRQDIMNGVGVFSLAMRGGGITDPAFRVARICHIPCV